MGKAIYQGTQNLPVSYLGTNYEKEVTGQTKVRQSIYRTSTLPAQYKQIKPETEGVGLGAGYEVTSAPRGSLGLIEGGTTVRPSIVRESVLPTINQGTTVLNTIFGGTTTRIAQQGAVYGQTKTVLAPTTTLQTVGTIRTTTTGSVMGVGGGIHDSAADVTYSTKPDIGVGATTTTTTQYGTGVGYATTGSVMGVGGVHDYAADVTYSTKP